MEAISAGSHQEKSQRNRATSSVRETNVRSNHWFHRPLIFFLSIVIQDRADPAVLGEQ